MNGNTKLLASGIIAVAVAVACSSSQQFNQVAPEEVDLSGTWILNPEESDDPSGQMDQMGGGAGGGGMRGGGGGGMRPSGGMGGGMRGGRGGMGGGMDPEKMRQTTEMVRQAAQCIGLQQGDSTVTLMFDQQRSLVLHIDGRELEQELPAGTKMEIRAGWKGRYFVVEREIDGGGKITEEYTISSGTGQLYVITRLELNDRMPQPLEFRRVYDTASESKE
jgi:hypothetical protein